MPLTLILSVGQDPVLLDTRSLILRAAGYLVESAQSVKQAISYFRAGDFDLVMLCHSISAQDRDRLTCLIRASGSLVPVVSVAAGFGQCPDSFADATIESGPDKLLTGIKKALMKAAAYQSRGAAKTDSGAECKAWHKRILCIDDDPNLLVIHRRLLEDAGYHVLTAHCGPDGLKVFSTGIVNAVVLDYAMPIMNGGAVAAQMRQIQKDVPLILHSGCSEIPENEIALFDRIISKGAPPDALLSAIEQVLCSAYKREIA